jgi:uncharacterized protein (DUF2267 family)
MGFIDTIRDTARVSSDEAERSACATLTTLAERLSTGETEDIAARVPEQLRHCLAPEAIDRKFHADEFLRRVATRVGVDEAAAERDARAVFAALWLAVGPDEFADMRSELPKDFDPLLDKALATPPARQGLGLDEFIERVATRAGIDAERARKATEAVLEVLAIRVTAGQIEDLEARLPAGLRPALERGRALSGPDAVPLSLDRFLAEVASREGVSPEEAAQHARAVFMTLREAVGEKELGDTLAQLPASYRPLWR